MTVLVDNDFARFGAKSYAINKINSVEVRERQPHGIGGAIVAGILGILFLLSSLGAMASPQGAPVTTLVIGLALLAISYWQWQRTKIREYLLFLMTSSSETQAFVTRDQSEVNDLRFKIENAMVHHSQGAIRQA
ncbi:hypothetical protein ACVWZA_001326 [Sphingomonas sp. UYAg733]